MKNRLIKIISLILVLTALLCLFSVSAFAETKNLEVEARLLEEIKDSKGNVIENAVGIDIVLNKNPGIGAYSFTLSYDKNYFMTRAGRKAKFYSCVLPNYLIVDHPDEGYVSMVWAEQNSNINTTRTGVIMSLDFYMYNKVPGNYQFKIKNINPKAYGEDLTGTFADFEHNKIKVNATNASYFVPNADGSCAVHDFGPKSEIKPDCMSGGYIKRQCKRCGFVEKTNEVPALGHSVPDYWIVDRPYSEQASMVLSHYCTKCNVNLEKIYVSSDKARELKLDNTLGAHIKDSLINSKAPDLPKKENNQQNNGSELTNSEENVIENEHGDKIIDVNNNGIIDSDENVIVDKNGQVFVDKNGNGKMDANEKVVINKKGKVVIDKNNNGVTDKNEKGTESKSDYSAEKIIEKIISGEKEDLEFESSEPKTIGDIVLWIKNYLFGKDGAPGLFEQIIKAIRNLFK